MLSKRPLPKDAILVPKNAKKAFSGNIYDTYQWQQKMYDGSYATFEMLKRSDTVEVIAVIDDEVVLIEENQPNISDSYYTIPGGRVDPGEDLYKTAKRELLEETGMEFDNWKLVHIKQPARKIEWFIYTFVATNLILQTKQKLDAGEKIKVQKVPYKKLLDLVKNGNLLISDYLQIKLLHNKTKLADVLEDKEIR